MFLTKILIFFLLFSQCILGAEVHGTEEKTQGPSEVKHSSPPLKRKLVPQVLDLRDDRDPQRIEAIKLGRIAYASKNFQDAFHHFKVAANFNGGSALGMYYFGSMHFLGQGTIKNPLFGLLFLEAAAEYGLREACFDLGLRYLKGDDLPRDTLKAERYFKKLPQNRPKYRYHHGLIKYHNSVLSQGKLSGLQDMIAAAAEGYDVAQKVMEDESFLKELASLRFAVGANLYWYGKNEHDKLTGLRLIRQAAKGGNQSAKKEIELNHWNEELSSLEKQASDPVPGVLFRDAS